MTMLSTTMPDDDALPPVMRGTGHDEGPPTAGEIMSMLRRRQVQVIFLFVLFSGLVVGGFLAWWTYFPGYRAEALVECISNIPDTELTLEQERLRQDEHDRFVMTQALLLKSPGILSEALKLTTVRETDWYQSEEPGKHLLELTEDIHATPVRGTNFLRVSMECKNVKDPATIVNEVVNQWYRSIKKRTAEEFADTALDAALEERGAMIQEIEEGRDQLRGIALRLPAGAKVEGAGNNTNEQVGQYSEQVGLLQLELSQLEQYRSIYNNPAGVAVTAEDRAIVELDPQVMELARALLILTQQRASDAKVFGEEHRVLKQLDAQIDAAEANLAQLRLERLNERRADIREAANTAFANTQYALFLAQERLAESEAALADQDRLLFDYFNIEEEIELKVQYLQNLDEYVKSLNRIKTQRTAIRINLAQVAIDPLERSTPSLYLIPVGIVGAFALALLIPLGFELLDTSVRTSQDVVRHLDIPLLGLVPHADDEEVSLKRVETAVRDAPRSMIAEAFRGVRTSLQFSAPAERRRSLLVTSPHAEDGKTSVACNLALAATNSGRRVLLVDANLRRPMIHTLFDNVPTVGLSNILIGDGFLSSMIVHTNIDGLDVLGSGPPPPNPGELLGGQKMHEFLSEVVSRYDQVILDTAPVLLANDAQVLAPAVDGTIMVVRAKQNSRGAARRACAQLVDVGAHLFGAVLNAAQVSRGGYFREQLRAYYEYQPQMAKVKSKRPLKPDPAPPPTSET
jgi:capsular exopolysaccharide synthesis family protein